ncbi:50S ribosomal protein L2 [Candidatus Saccharibacteria bacterium]|nr:50S ribosomal protein L2 [Candidatus Saccharibacteria bacterium]MCL1962685.1 50S ribosomal protein L2 [Candidatus Saccharibacteria bacterium]
MAITKMKPTTPARRGMTTADLDSITTKKPVKSLVTVKKKTAGRNNQGRITTRHHGGGAKQFLRNVNFNLAPGSVATIEHIEYDPNRSARIARVRDESGELHYIIAANGMTQGQKVRVAGDSAVAVETGNRMMLRDIPTGATIHNIEITIGKGAQAVRAAGARAQLTAKEGDYAMVKMPSGEVRKFRLECMATIGAVGNEQHQNIKIGSAGRKRRMGIRPTVRGVVMNAVDHPHGGGDGGRHGTGKAPRTPWGQLTIGYRTRHRKSTNKMIVRSRHEAKRRK